MDIPLQARPEQLTNEIAGEAQTAEGLNGLIRLMMKSALERMLDTEMDVHLGRKKPGDQEPVDTAASEQADQAAKKNHRCHLIGLKPATHDRVSTGSERIVS